MEERKGLENLLERLDQSNRQQIKFAKWQCFFSIAATVCVIGLFALVYGLMPQIQELTAQTEVVLANLTQITNQLAEMDLGAVVENLDGLVITSQIGVEQAVQKLNAIDFETLNQAIEDLADVIEPLANFFGGFY